MDKHYYLVAQLPILFFDRSPAITIEGFLAEAEKWMGQREYAVLAGVDIHHATPDFGAPEVLRSYQAFEFNLRNELALWRKTRGTDQEYRPLSFPISIVRDHTPLEAERELLRLRWNYINEEALEHHFDLGFLIFYFLKLQILHRLSTFDKEEGLETFQNLCEVEV